MIDGVHFRLREGWLNASQVGHRALAAALSDLAAMGARPGEAYLVLGIPEGFSTDAALALVRGANALATATGTAIAGGDVVAAPALTVSVTAVGWCDREQQIVTRAGAHEGLPLGGGVAEVAEQLGVHPFSLAAGAGDDYELCFTAARSRRGAIEAALEGARGEGVTWIGEAVRAASPLAPGASMLAPDGS